MVLPIMIPGLLIGVSLLVLFTSVFHQQLSPTTAVIGQSVYTTPFVLLLVAARLQGFDARLERAASDLGANTFNRLRYVVLPLLAPAILAGALFAFTLSLDEFIITLFLIGSHNTLPIYIYTQVKFGITPEVNALATLLLAASLCLIALAFVLPGSSGARGRLVPRRARASAATATQPPSRALATRRLQDLHAAVTVGERRERAVVSPGHRAVPSSNRFAERVAVAFCVARPGSARTLRARPAFVAGSLTTICVGVSHAGAGARSATPGPR